MKNDRNKVLSNLVITDHDANTKVNYSNERQEVSLPNSSSTGSDLPVVKPKIKIMSFVSTEVVAFLFLFAMGLSSGVITNALLKSYCMLIPNITAGNCSGLIPSDIENVVQSEVSLMIQHRTFIETLLPGLAILFIGPWSDKNGRRPFLLLSLLGYTLSYFIWAALSTQVHLQPAYYLIASIPIGLTGGVGAFFLTLLCAISDMTTVQQRAIKMAVFEAACMAGSFTSQLFTARVSSGPYGFTIAFSLSGFLCLISIMYVYFFFPETVSQSERVHQKGSVLDALKTTFKSRSNHVRSILFLLILANTAYITIVFGESAIFYLNTQKRFSWQLQDYANFTSYSVVISGLVLYFCTWFISSVLHLNDMTSFFIVSIPRICSSLIYALCTNWILLYVGITVGCIATLITPLYRSLVSKLVPSNELSKVMSFIICTEAMVPVAATTLYVAIYNATIDVFPGAIFLASAGLSVVCTICITISLIVQSCYPSPDFSLLPDAGTQEAVPEGNEEVVNKSE